MHATALIAEDEPLLAAELQATLARLWPELRIVASVGDGASAVTQSLALQPDVLFLDIRMPAMSGLDAAVALADAWPATGDAFPLLVFVTAYDQYALAAFERAAVDYVLKPVQPERLAQTCARLQARLVQRATARDVDTDTTTGSTVLAQSPAGSNATTATAAKFTASATAPLTVRGAPASSHPALEAALEQLRALLLTTAADATQSPSTAPLRMIQAASGNTVALVPVDDVLFFEAADKYVRVVTASREHLIRTPLRELQRQLDPERFWQVHRGIVVRCDAIDHAQRDENGRLTLVLRGHPEHLAVSRLYAERFKGM